MQSSISGILTIFVCNGDLNFSDYLFKLKSKTLVSFVSLSRLVSRLFYDCDQAQADPVVAIARDQSSVYLQLLMHETQPPSQFTVSTITR